MRRDRRPGTTLDLRLLVPAVAAWAVLAVAVGAPTVGVLAAAGCAALGSVWMVWRPPSRVVQAAPVLALAGAAVAVTLASCAAEQAARVAGPVQDLASSRAVVRAVVVVTTDPVVRPATGGGVTVIVRARVVQVEARGKRSRVSTPVLVLADERWQGVRWRERLTVRGALRPAEAGDDVVALLRPSAGPSDVQPGGWVVRVAEHVRSGLREAARPLPADARGLLPALVIGDTSRTPPDLTEAMLATGMTHLSAVSGSNVAIVLAFAMGTASLCGAPRSWRPALALVALAGFVVLARPEPSVIRAGAMGAIGLIGLSRSRRGAGVPVLSAAVVVLLVVDPWLSRSYGFALSTLATLGLLMFTRSWGEAISRRLPAAIRSWGPALAIPVAAQAMCAPVVVLLQGSVSVVGVLANLLAAPLVAPATVAGVAAAVVAPFWSWGATVLCWVGALPALGIAWTARTCATVPGGTMPWPDGAPGAVLLAGLTLALVVSAPWWTHVARTRPVVLCSAALVAVASVAPTSAVTWPPDGWRFVACDVGQGDGLVLATSSGRAVLVDAGPDPAAIDRCLRRLEVTALDAVVLTHFHADHVDGLPGALRGRAVGELLVSPVAEPASQRTQVATWAGARGIPVRGLEAGDSLSWAGVSAQVWWPARRIAAGSVANNASVVLAVQSGPVDLLLLGDVEREAARAMLLALRRDGSMTRSAARFDVVKVAHHGSANLDEDLMAAVAAPLALVSVGKDNDYGHPSPRALEVLRHHGSVVFRTDERGDIAVVVEGGRAAVTWQRR